MHSRSDNQNEADILDRSSSVSDAFSSFEDMRNVSVPFDESFLLEVPYITTEGQLTFWLTSHMRASTKGSGFIVHNTSLCVTTFLIL